MVAAHSQLHAAPPGTFTDVPRGPLFRFPGRHQRHTSVGLSERDLRAPAWCCGAFFIVVSTAWLGKVRARAPDFGVRVRCGGPSPLCAHFHAAMTPRGPSALHGAGAKHSCSQTGPARPSVPGCCLLQGAPSPPSAEPHPVSFLLSWLLLTLALLFQASRLIKVSLR